MRIRVPQGGSGFTLLEILVVLVVIGVLATLVAPNVFRHVGTAKEATAQVRGHPRLSRARCGARTPAGERSYCLTGSSGLN
ncbi:MAG: prepilin-type N-terminal cleavage/methylation domain-containing protein [Gemmatimonadota bacterium]